MPDVNLLLYAYDENSPFHKAASRWLEDALSEYEIFFSWHTLTGFLRISTNPTATKTPSTLAEAIAIVESWLALDNTHIVGLGKRNWKLFLNTLIDGQAKGNLVMDAHLAAVAIAFGVTLASADKDFTRFSQVKTVNPIQA